MRPFNKCTGGTSSRCLSWGRQQGHYRPIPGARVTVVFLVSSDPDSEGLAS